MPFDHWDKDSRNKRAADELKEVAGHHKEDLFDEKKRNLATGEDIDNSTYTGTEDFHSVEPGAHDTLPPIKEKDKSARAAEAWLNANDPERKKKRQN